jgi:hypothetical protein
MNKGKALFPNQVVPLGLTFVICVFFVAVLFGEIHLLNALVIQREAIIPHLRWSDVLVGMTIYLKTSIDFAIFIGRLMQKFPGWKNRVMIEIGTAAGNALGTMGILLVWDLFREVRFLMAIMIFMASLVLLRLAEDGLEHVEDQKLRLPIIKQFHSLLTKINHAVAPVLSKLVPNLSVDENKNRGFKGLFMLSFTVPFILGLDDFAGYIPLFNVVNVFGFGTGVFLGHMILNILLFLSPNRTIKAVKNPTISLVGSIAFVALAIWGLFEAAKLIGIAH